MATLLLGAAGAAIGGSVGGSVLGLSGAVLGRAAGAAVGRAVDARLLGGGGSDPVDHGRVERFRLTGAAEGAAVPRVWGRVRVAGQVIWASPFREHVEMTGGGGGGKGRARRPAARRHSYSVSLAVALCEGPILRVGRVWADGQELALDTFERRVHHGGEDQLPDALIEVEEGAEAAPAYRGTAYVVIEGLDLAPWGNRVPSFDFEVVRAVDAPGEPPAPSALVRGVSLIPGTGEYALATERVDLRAGPAEARSANVHSPAEVPDMVASLAALREEVPGLRSASLVVTWFGDDLRCGDCRIRPMVDQKDAEGDPMPWGVAGLGRGDAALLPRLDGRAISGGTPSDASVVQAIRALRADGHDVCLHPFVMMTQLPGNALRDPYGRTEQPALPWRGRITAAAADGTAAVDREVGRFFGQARAADVTVGDGVVRWHGAAGDWGFRRFVLHQAALAATAGGVESIVLGSEMRGLTRLRGADGSFPAVAALRALAAEVRALLPGARIGYAADWTEYGGYVPADAPSDLFFPLDPLWGDDAIDFVGVNNYAPLADWRDGADHADAGWGSEHRLDYLRSNVEGGEGYDWFYRDDADRAAQRRRPITDGAHGEAWAFRPKDFRGWWAAAHRERRGGVRADAPTSWVPRSKPIRFVEYGCAAVDKGANAPNRFPDPISSEGGLPPFSTGARDDAMQMQYLRAFLGHWGEVARNPASDRYDGRMIDLDHSTVWAWDVRPWPAFPLDREAWGDGGRFGAGHWWSGRSSHLPLATVIADLCRRAGVERFDVSGVRGAVAGYAVEAVQTPRADLQPLLVAHGIVATERDGRLVFSMRMDAAVATVRVGSVVRTEGAATVEETRRSGGEAIGQARLRHVSDDGSFAVRLAEAADPRDASPIASEVDLPLVLGDEAGEGLAERLLWESRDGTAAVRLALPPSRRTIGPGDLLRVEGHDGVWRVDRVTEGTARTVEALRVAPRPGPARGAAPAAPRREVRHRGAVAPRPVFLDLPAPHGGEPALHVAVGGAPWRGPMPVLVSSTGGDYRPAAEIEMSALVGVTETALAPARPGVSDRGAPLRVRLGPGELRSVSWEALLAGANAMAIGEGRADGWEVLQFRDASPLGEGRWALSHRLRGQNGTESAMRDPWPAGSLVVVLSDALATLPVAADAIGLPQHVRVIDAAGTRPWQDVVTPVGIASRPYAPAHLRVARVADGDRFAWVRRTRHGGDRWDREVPLSEIAERYAVRLFGEGGASWEGEVVQPGFDLDRAARLSRIGSGPYRFEVAQVSDSFGPGAWRSITVP